MEIVYLPTGQSCYLKEKIGDRFIVNKIYEYNDLETEEVYESPGDDIVVDHIFPTMPMPKFEQNLKEVIQATEEKQKEKQELQSEVHKLKYELSAIKKSVIDEQSFVINKNDLIRANSIAFFVDKQIMPVTLKSDNYKYGGFRGLRISLEVAIRNKEERSWGYRLWHEDDTYNHADFLCKKDGVVVNPTEEILDAIIRRRVSEIDTKDQHIEYTLNPVPDEYLTPELLKIKQDIASSKLVNEIAHSKSELAKLQERVIQLQEKINSTAS